MIPCIEYTRASTSHQEYSVSDQHRSIGEWAKRNNYKVIKTYSDDGISGHYAAKRPAFLEMIEDITAERLEVKALLIWDSFRFARNMVEFLTYKNMIQEHGISVIAVSEPYVEDDDARLYIDAINGASGELYLRKLSKDSKRGIRAKVVERREHLGFAPFGYRMDNHTLVVDPTEADWVRYIFDEVIKGTPYLQICQSLNTDGIYTKRGVRWTVQPLKYLLGNKTYCGELECHLDGKYGVYEGKHEPIIDKDTFERVQGIIAERASKRKKYEHSTNQYVHWLSGLLRCPICGGAMSHVKRPGGRTPAYRCNGYASGTGCTNGSVRVPVIEGVVYDELEKIFTDPRAIKTAKITTIRPHSVIDYDAQIGKLKSQLSRAKKAYIEEIDTLEEYRENKSRISSAIIDLEERKKTLPDKEVSEKEFKDRCKHALNTLKSNIPMDEKAAVAHDLIDRIMIDSHKKEVNIEFYG